jgi:cell division protein FtsQ
MKIKKNILSILGWVVILIFLVLSMSFVNNEEHKQLCTKLNIEVIDSTEFLFIDKNEIKQLVRDSNISVIGYPVSEINTLKIENILKTHSSIKDVRTYCSLKGHIGVEITQRKPILRIINYSGESYYIDKDGVMMHLSDIYTARVIVVSGHINEPFEARHNINLKESENNNIIRGRVLKDIFNLVSYINNDKLWRSQFQQIYINSDGEYELIPIVGTQKIILGKIDNYKTKLRNLKAFYKRGIEKRGWNKYSEINLKYENQIVCTKK